MTLQSAHQDLSRIERLLEVRPREDKAIQDAIKTLQALKRELADNPSGAKLENWTSILLLKAKGNLR